MVVYVREMGPVISGKPRLVKYYILARIFEPFYTYPGFFSHQLSFITNAAPMTQCQAQQSFLRVARYEAETWIRWGIPNAWMPQEVRLKGKDRGL